MSTKKESSFPTLTSKQIAYATNRAKGMNKARSYLEAGYKAPDLEQASSSACKLEEHPKVKAYLESLKESGFLAQALSIAEKRAFLARAVRCHASNPDPDLVQEYAETTNEHGTSKRVKIVSKLEALNIDNKMAGDYYSDREPQATNPFLWIVGLSKSLPMQQAQHAQSLPDHSVIDAEVTALE